MNQTEHSLAPAGGASPDYRFRQCVQILRHLLEVRGESKITGLAGSAGHANALQELLDVHLPRLQKEADQRRLLLDELVDRDPCIFDSNGYCQGHGWLQTEPTCPHRRAKEML